MGGGRKWEHFEPKIPNDIALIFSHFPHLGLPKLNTNNLQYYTILKAYFYTIKLSPTTELVMIGFFVFMEMSSR